MRYLELQDETLPWCHQHVRICPCALLRLVEIHTFFHNAFTDNHSKPRSQHGHWSSEHSEDLCGDHLPGFNGTLCRYNGLPLISYSHVILILQLLGLERALAQTGAVSTGWPVGACLPQICFLLLYGLLLFIWFLYYIVHIYTTVLLKPRFWLVRMWLLL